MLQQQIHEMNFQQYQKLHSSMDFQIQERTKEAIATANNALLEEKSRFQLQEIRKLHGKVKDMEVELKNCHQENSRLKAKTMNLHDQLLHARTALERRVQERISMDEENEFFKQRLCSLEVRIQDDGNQQFSGAPCFEDEFAHDEREGNDMKEMCDTCRSSTNKSIRRSPMQYGEFNSYCTLRKFLNETQDTQISHILMREASKGRLFGDNDISSFEMHHEENSQNWNESRSRPAPGNAAHSDDTFSALSHLSCRFEQFADHPSTKRKEPSREEPTLSRETNSLKLSLYLANRLGSELLQELYSIVNHDILCLEVHAASKGTVGKSLVALQVLLVESANVGLRLFSTLSSVASTKLQQLIQEVANNWASAYPEDCWDTGKGFADDSDDMQLLLEESGFSMHSTHDTADREGMNGWCVSSKAVRDSVRQSNTWDQSLDGASLLSSQDPGEDICNIDLHQACDEDPKVELSSHSPSHSVSLNVQMTYKQQSTEMNQEYLRKVQADENFAEEIKIMQNMSEAEKRFTNQLLNKVEALEARLTVAEMEIVEHKVEIEHLRVNNVRASMEASLHSDDWELQNLRVECEIQKEEIQQLMEQVMTPDDVLERESLLRETMERKKFLENCLKKAEMRLITPKGWREELLQLREAESRRELLTSGGATKQASLSTPPRKFDTTPAWNQDEMAHPPDPDCRSLRAALGELHNNLLQPRTLNDFGGHTSNELELRKLLVSDLLEKENQSFVFTSPL